jgi:hypothetical protein
MKETAKTLIFVAVAAAAVLVAVFLRPSLPSRTLEDERNQAIYPSFTDPLKVASLEIVTFDEKRGEPLMFRVARIDVKGKERWSIPSHANYPADAKDQVAAAATGLMGLKVLNVVTSDEAAQRDFGVVDPEKAKPGDTGVGTRVVMKDKDGKDLLALVIGNAVSSDRPNLRYVRKANLASIYEVEARTDKLSTNFEDWIERNLLGLNTFDVKDIWIRDYSVDRLNGTVDQRGDMRIDYNDAGEPKWKMTEDRKFVVDEEKQTAKWVPIKMADTEELNSAKLDELLTALSDLKIVNVAKKPVGLSADLKAAADFAKNREAVESLARRGFFVAKLEGEVQLFSNEGEICILCNNGVEYILRFGQVTGESSPKKDDKDKAKTDGKKADKKSDEPKPGGLSRYLFVMADFVPDAIPRPQLEALPEVKKEAEKKASDAIPEEKKPADAKAAEVKPASVKAGEKKSDEKKDETKPGEKPAEAKKADEKKPDDAKALEAERERIEKDNKRKQEEYQQKLTDGKKRVAELNARFSDWYYVISDDVYQKIHLGRGEIVKKKDAPKPTDKAAGDAKAAPALPESLDKLKQEGPAGQ